MQKSEEEEKLTSCSSSKKDDSVAKNDPEDSEMNPVDSEYCHQKQSLSEGVHTSSTDQPEDSSTFKNAVTIVPVPSTEASNQNRGIKKEIHQFDRPSSKRQRNPVVRIEHQYSQIYDTVNNRSYKKRKSSHDDTNNNIKNIAYNTKSSKSSSSLSSSSPDYEKPNHHPTSPSTNISSIGTNSSSVKECENTTSIPMQTYPNSDVFDPDPAFKSSNKKYILRRRPPSYRWIGKSNLTENGSSQYTKLEIKVGNHASLIQVGDTVLLCSGDMEEDELYGGPPLPVTNDYELSTSEKKNAINDHIALNANIDRKTKIKVNTDFGKDNEWNQFFGHRNPNGQNRQNSNEEDFHYEKLKMIAQEDDSVLGMVAGDIAINALDPFVARIESMWEEPKTNIPSTTQSNMKNKNKNNNIYDKISSDSNLHYHDERRARMKFRARWYFKKEDMQGLGGQFVGVSRDEVLKNMTPRDLVLGDQMDDNEVSTILGKCLVLQRRPGNKSNAGYEIDNDIKDNPNNKSQPNSRKEILPPKGAFICCYNLTIQPANSRSNSPASVQITPYEGIDEPDPRLITKKHSSNQISKFNNFNKNDKKTTVIKSLSDRKTNVENPSNMNQTSHIDKGTCDENNHNINEHSPLTSTATSLGQQSIRKTIFESNGDKNMSLLRYGGVVDDNKDCITNVETKSPLYGSNKHKNGDKNEDGNEKHMESASILSQNDDIIDRSNDVEILASGKKERSVKKPHTSEGVTTQGKIHVGENHQAIMPSLVTKKNQYHPCRSTKPILIWQPDKLSGEQIEKFMLEVAKILNSYLTDKGINYPGNHLVYTLAQKIENEQNLTKMKKKSDSRNGIINNSTVKMFRKECDVDKIMGLLHAQNYNTSEALNQVLSSPSAFMTLWTNQEKVLFNAGFRRYCGSLRMITRGIGPTKSHKDVVDYHYRFKIPFQFLRYQEKKREQAGRMLHYLDENFFLETMSKSGDQGFAKSSQNGNGNSLSLKKMRSWSSTGRKGEETIGATEQRRVLAKDYLMNTRDIIGTGKYHELAMCLKLFHEREIDIHLLKNKIKDLLQNYPDTLMRFLAFLPKKLRA